MVTEATKNQSDLEQRSACIRLQPCFASLTAAETEALANLMVEKYFLPNETLVHEEDVVDSIDWIVRGQAEVRRGDTILAVIGKNEAIGLQESGFFSSTGKRTATVVAISKIKIFQLSMKNLSSFFEKYPQVSNTMQQATKQMLRMQLIKQSLPFHSLSHQRLQWLATRVEEMYVPAGTVLFQQGEIADECYLIRTGKIEIFNTNEEGAEHRLAVLQASALFGEATAVTKTVRNASARTLEDSELLLLKHEYLSELLETEKNIASTFMNLMVDRSKPLPCSHITSHQQKSSDGQKNIILKNTHTKKYFKLSEQGWFIWQQLNGQKTMQEITLAFADQFQIFSPDTVAAIISKLTQAGFVKNIEMHSYPHHQPMWLTLLSMIRRVMEGRLAMGNMDPWLTRVYAKSGYLFFTRIGQWILALLTFSGVIAFAYFTKSTVQTFQIMPDMGWLIVGLIPAMLMTAAIHELGHALTTKAFGYEVHYMGIGWYWIGPVAFTDTSDMWLSTRGPRMAVNLAGIYTDVITAGIAALLIFLFSNPYFQAFLWLFALLTYVHAFRMLNPLQELDGYYALMDYLERPTLRQQAILWLVHKAPTCWRQPRGLKHDKAELIYWAACIFFLIVISVMTFFLQAFIFKILGFQPAHFLLTLSLPILVALVSSLGMIADIRKY